MPSLSELVGRRILAVIDSIEADKMTEYRLHGVEASGLWISNKKTNELFMERASRRMLEKTPIFFVPFHSITFVFGMDEGLQVSDKLLE